MSDRTVCEHDVNPVEKCPVCYQGNTPNHIPDSGNMVGVRCEDLDEAIEFLRYHKSNKIVQPLLTRLRAAKEGKYG